MCIKEIGEYRSGNGTVVNTSFAEIGGSKCVQRLVFLPENSPLRKCGIDAFYKVKSANPELSKPITAMSNGTEIACGIENVRKLIRTLKNLRLK